MQRLGNEQFTKKREITNNLKDIHWTTLENNCIKNQLNTFKLHTRITMAVIVKYVVERNGEEKMTFTSKAEADAYDKMLDMADELFTLLENSKLIEEDDKKEELSLYLAQNKEEVLYALGAKRKPAPKKSNKVTPEESDSETPEQAA